MSPSWEVHEIACKILIGFYNKNIDKIIDIDLSHDSSRYDIKELVRASKLIKDQYGLQGLKQLILHHYLDRLSDLAVSTLTMCFMLYSSGSTSVEEAASKFVDMMSDIADRDPNNILNLFAYEISYLKYVAEIWYSGIKKKNCLARLDKAYSDLQLHSKELEDLRPLVRECLRMLRSKLEFILYLVLVFDDNITHRIINSVNMMLISRLYKMKRRMPPERYEEYEKQQINKISKELNEYYDKVLEILEKKCDLQSYIKRENKTKYA